MRRLKRHEMETVFSIMLEMKREYRDLFDTQHRYFKRIAFWLETILGIECKKCKRQENCWKNKFETMTLYLTPENKIVCLNFERR